jgi:hypothetical protein
VTGQDAFMPAASAPLSSTMVGDIRLTYLPDGIHHVRPLLIQNGASNTLVDLGFGPHSVDITELTYGEHEGDLIGGAVEIGVSELDFVFDVDPVLARDTKRRIERELAMPDTVTVGAHFPNLVFGRVLAGSVPLSVDFSGSTILK